MSDSLPCDGCGERLTTIHAVMMHTVTCKQYQAKARAEERPRSPAPAVNDCFIVHVHHQPGGMWAATITTITGQKITHDPVTGPDKQEVIEHACFTLMTFVDFSGVQSPAAYIPPDDRGCSEPV